MKNLHSICSKIYLSTSASLSVQFLHWVKHTLPDAINAVSNLALKVLQVVADSYNKVFNISAGSYRDQICYMIRGQWQSYQMQEIPEEFYISNNDINPGSTHIQKMSY